MQIDLRVRLDRKIDILIDFGLQSVQQFVDIHQIVWYTYVETVELEHVGEIGFSLALKCLLAKEAFSVEVGI